MHRWRDENLPHEPRNIGEIALILTSWCSAQPAVWPLPGISMNVMYAVVNMLNHTYQNTNVDQHKVFYI